ncbi:MAG: glycosyltransferase [Nitrospirae bacterium]|nr:glycosyltransferase [Nitrospirota bacterium]
MSAKTPKVSVCIPTYNRPDLLKLAMESVLEQTFRDYELIISDNASGDSTAAVITSFKDCRIIHIRKEKNVGLVDNWNSCLASAKGKYITIFHDDDRMLPENLAFKVEALDRNERVGMVHSNFHIIDENGYITKKNAHFIESNDFVETGLSFLRKSLLGYNPVNPPSVVIRKECFEKLGGFSKRIHFTTDLEYWMRIAMHYDVTYLARPLIEYRMYHKDGWTSSKYLTLIDGDTFSNINGLLDEYTTRKIILNQTRNILNDWKYLNGSVRNRMIGSVNRVVEKQFLVHGEKGEAIKSVFRVCKAFPDLLYDISMTRLIVKTLMGLQMTGVLKRLLMNPLDDNHKKKIS